MKRGKKLVLLTAALAVIVAVTLIVQAIVSKNNEDAAEDAASVVFLTVDSAAVTGLAWTYNSETVHLGYNGGQWTNADDAAFPVDPAYPDQMLETFKEVTASRSFDAGDLGEYGLDAPAYTVVIDAATQTTLAIGNASDISGEYYASIGDGKVYLVEAALLEPFQHTSADVLLRETIPAMADLQGIDVATKTGELNLTYLENGGDYTYSDSYHWFQNDNGAYKALGTPADTFASSLTGLTWLSCENYNATDEDLKTYGLDAPNATVTLRYAQAADDAEATTAPDGAAETAEADTAAAEAASTLFMLEIGSFTDTGYYARIQGSRMVYLIDATLAQNILNASYESLMPTDICPLNWDTVTSFDVTLDGAAYAFTRGTKDSTDADGNVTQEAIFLMNGTEVDSTLVQAVLDDLTNMQSTGAAAQVPGASEISFAFHRNTATYTEITLAFYRADSAACIVGFNGETRLTVARADVVSLIEAVHAIVLQ